MTESPFDPDDVAALVDRAATAVRSVPGAEAFEIRADRRLDSRISVLNGEPFPGRREVFGGLGIRVFVGSQSAYVHTDEPTPDAVRGLAERAVAMAAGQARRGWKPTAVAEEPVVARRARYAPKAQWRHSEEDEREALAVLKRVVAAGRARASGASGHATLGALAVHTVVTDSLGSQVEVGSLLSTLYTAISRKGERFGNGTAMRAGELGLASYTAGSAPEELGNLAGERAEDAARAIPVRSGRYRVLCDNELSGTLAHESFGHLTEYDLVSSGWSTLQGRRGEALAAADVSVVDSPVVLDGREGVVVPLDDQGTRGQEVRVLDRGVLRRWLHTRESAHEAGDPSQGNGRALNASFPPMVRMRNTFFEPGDRTVEEALEQLGDGLYLCGSRGGQPSSDGSFMFIAIRGYQVEGGRITAPVRTAAIHGNILDFLRQVECQTRDFHVATNYFGGCGKRDQSFLHVGVGGPHVLVGEALVGASG